MSTLKERLEKAMAGPPVRGPAELAHACGVRQPSVSDWLSGRTKKLEGTNLLAAAEFLKVRYWWLATGKGPMHGQLFTDMASNPEVGGSSDSRESHERLKRQSMEVAAQLAEAILKAAREETIGEKGLNNLESRLHALIAPKTAGAGTTSMQPEDGKNHAKKSRRFDQGSSS